MVAVKYVFDAAIALQFTCSNTVAEQILENVTVAVDLADAVREDPAYAGFQLPLPLAHASSGSGYQRQWVGPIRSAAFVVSGSATVSSAPPICCDSLGPGGMRPHAHLMAASHKCGVGKGVGRAGE